MLHNFEHEEIIELNKTEFEWGEIEASDMFQKGNYIGGFEEIENAFTFSYFLNEKEYWFQLTLNEIRDVVNLIITEVEIIEADLF